MANRRGNNRNSDRLYFLGLQNHCRWWLQPWNWKTLAAWKTSYDQPREHIKKQRHYSANKSSPSQRFFFCFFVFFSPSSVQFSSVAQLCLTLCDPMNRSTPDFPVHLQLPEFTQTRVHQVSDAIQPSWPLSSPLLPAFKSFPASGSFPVSQFFASGSQSIGALASIFPMNI